MSKNKYHIDEETFRRYLADEMSNAERNAFEKELQKNPFETEAMEGFDAVSSSGFTNELNEIRKQTQPEKRKNRMPYFATAASILLLITAGVIWIQLNDKEPLPKMTENKEQVESRKSEVGSQAGETFQLQSQAQLSDRKSEKEASADEVKKIEVQESSQEESAELNNLEIIMPASDFGDDKKAVAEAKAEPEDEIIMPVAEAPRSKSPALKAAKKSSEQNFEVKSVTVSKKTNSITQNKNIVRGRVISNDDNMPIAGVTIMEKGTNNGIVTDIDGQFQLKLENDTNPVVASFIGMETNEFYAQSDSDNVIRLNANNEALSEVVVIGYGVQRKKDLTGYSTTVEQSPRNTDPVPVGGMQAYKKHLQKNAILPADYPKNKVVIKALLHLNELGEIIAVENTNKADTMLFNRAQEIIMEEPGWEPGYENNRAVEAQVKLRIIFRK